MIELMKQYEEEVWDKADIIGHTNGRSYIYLGFAKWVTYKLKLMNKKNAQLKEALRWRPVSEKPEKADMYFAEVRPYTGCESTIITTAYFDGERFPWHDVVKWLPIPPAPEGE
jgi:hypothetical protein